jgi:predicted Zn-dependent peptidase
VICEELRLDDDMPDDRSATLADELLFGDHPLGRETAGLAEVVATIPADAVRAFRQRWYRAANVTVSVAGPVEHGDVVTMVERWFELPDGGAAPCRHAPANGRTKVTGTQRRRTEQAHVTIGWRTLERRHPDRYALEVLNHQLGGAMTSRLFERVREREQLAYSVYSGTTSFDDAGTLTVHAGTAAEQLDRLVSSVMEEVDAVRQGSTTQAEVDDAISAIVGSFELWMEGTAARMARVGGQLATDGFLTSVDDTIERFREVTPDRVTDVARRLLDPADAAVAVVGPVGARAVAALAANYGRRA